MEFVEGGVDRSDHKCEDEDALMLLTEGSIKQRGEDCVFGQVAAFADDELDRGDRGVGHSGGEPAEKRTDEARGVFGRKQIGGPDEDENHPGNDRQPVFQEPAHRKRNHNASACASLARVTKPRLTQPLVFEPIFMERVWGGRRLESLYGKRLPSAALVGESWEIVDRPEAQSVVHEGPFRGRTLHQLWGEQREAVFGNVPDAPRFPILAKLLDAQENLSLQVHPPAAVAGELGGESKSELWYVADAAPKARLYAGIKKGCSRAIFAAALERGRIEDQLHSLEIAAGDTIFLPSGRLHALGGGTLVVEIQENSDTTYRVYDWSRMKKGHARRQMHIEEAMKCIDFEDFEPGLLRPEGEALVRHATFAVDKWVLDAEREIAEPGRFAIGACVTGELSCAGREFKPGEFFLVPAQLEDRVLRPKGENVSLLRVTSPR